MDYTDSRTSRGASSIDVDHAISHAAKGGIVTFVWHWGAPIGLYDTPEQRWWSGFYTDATDFDIAATLADPTGANYTLLMKDIDTIAVQLKKLQDAGIPVLWRPLHEAEGGWFWWGAKGPEACRQCKASSPFLRSLPCILVYQEVMTLLTPTPQYTKPFTIVSQTTTT